MKPVEPSEKNPVASEKQAFKKQRSNKKAMIEGPDKGAGRCLFQKEIRRKSISDLKSRISQRGYIFGNIFEEAGKKHRFILN